MCYWIIDFSFSYLVLKFPFFAHSNMWRINQRWREMLQIIPFHRIGNSSTVTNRRKHYFVTSKCVIMNGDDRVCLCVRETQLWFANTKRKRRENKNSFQLNVESLCVLVYVGVGESNMIIRWMKISLALVLSLILTISLTKLVISVWENFNFGTGERYNVEVWLEQNQLHQYKDTFRKRGKCPSIYRWLSVHSLEKNESKLSSIGWAGLKIGIKRSKSDIIKLSFCASIPLQHLSGKFICSVK